MDEFVRILHSCQGTVWEFGLQQAHPTWTAAWQRARKLHVRAGAWWCSGGEPGNVWRHQHSSANLGLSDMPRSARGAHLANIAGRVQGAQCCQMPCLCDPEVAWPGEHAVRVQRPVSILLPIPHEQRGQLRDGQGRASRHRQPQAQQPGCSRLYRWLKDICPPLHCAFWGRAAPGPREARRPQAQRGQPRAEQHAQHHSAQLIRHPLHASGRTSAGADQQGGTGGCSQARWRPAMHSSCPQRPSSRSAVTGVCSSFMGGSDAVVSGAELLGAHGEASRAQDNARQDKTD